MVAAWRSTLNAMGRRLAHGDYFADSHLVGLPGGHVCGGDPPGGRLAQVVGGSRVRAATSALRLGRVVPAGGSAAAVLACMSALAAVRPGANSGPGSARIAGVRAVAGERFDGAAEEVAG